MIKMMFMKEELGKAKHVVRGRKTKVRVVS